MESSSGPLLAAPNTQTQKTAPVTCDGCHSALPGSVLSSYCTVVIGRGAFHDYYLQ